MNAYPLTEMETTSDQTREENLYFRICFFPLSIYKPLIPLKLVLFFFHGASAAAVPFIVMYFQQRGMTVSELSLIIIILPIIQFLGSTIAGFITDKLGRVKPVLLGHLLLVMLILVSMVLLRSMQDEKSGNESVHLSCQRLKTSGAICDILIIIRQVLMILVLALYFNCDRLIDVTAMYLVEEHNADFGRQRVWSVMGSLAFIPFTVHLITATSVQGGPMNYNAAFYLSGAAIIVTMVLVCKMKVQNRIPSKKMCKNSLTLLKNPDYISFQLILFVLGTAWSSTVILTYSYLTTLNAPSLLLVLLGIISGLYSLPFLYTSKWWVNKIGSVNFFILALLGYTVNFLGYSFLQDPWWSVFLETIQILTRHLLWVAVILHSHSIAPEGLTSTIISSAGGMHYGIGSLAAGQIGILALTSNEEIPAFRIMAAICLASAVLYTVYHCCRKRYSENSSETNDNNVHENTA